MRQMRSGKRDLNKPNRREARLMVSLYWQLKIELSWFVVAYAVSSLCFLCFQNYAIIMTLTRSLP